MSTPTIEFYPNLNEHLQNCQSSDSAQRKQAESALTQLRDADIRKFLASLVKEIADENNTETARQMAAVICKNLIANRSDARHADIWIQLEPFFKQNMKQAILGTLACQSQLVRSQSASLISAIAAIEIPRGEWTDLIGNLCTNANHDQVLIKMSSLQTLGFICEELDQSHLSPELKNAIVGALTTNINAQNADPQVTLEASRLAIKALLHSLPYAHQNFQHAEQRDFIFSKIFEAAKLQDGKIQESAMQCLVELARLEYETIQFYYDQICTCTGDAAKTYGQEAGAQGIEFWTTLAEEEIYRSKKNQTVLGYIEKSNQGLVQLLLDCIVKVEFDDDEELDDEWGVQTSAGCCLQKVSILLSGKVVPQVIEFVKLNIVDMTAWQKRYSALIALGGILEVPDKAAMNHILADSLIMLLNMFKDVSIKVREAISWVIQKACEHHGDVLTNTFEGTQLVLQSIIQSLQDKPKISRNSSTALQKLAESLSPAEKTQRNNALTPYFQDIASALMANASRRDDEGTDLSLCQSSYSALIALIQCSCTDSQPVIQQMLMPFITMLNTSIDNPDLDQNRTSDIQEMIASLLQVVLVKIGHLLETETGNQIIQLLAKLFQAVKRVTEQGLFAYSGLCQGLQERVSVLEMGQYILHALNGEDEEVARVACGVVSDISSALKGGIEQYQSSFVPPLLEILKNDNHDRMTKLQALTCLGDMCIYAGVPFIKVYLPDTLRILESAGELTLSKNQYKDDVDTFDYLVELQQAIVDTYSAIVNSVSELSDQTHMQMLVGYTPKILNFLNAMTTNGDMETFVQIAGLLGDVAGCCGKYINQEVFAQQWIIQLMNHLVQQNDKNTKEVGLWLQEQLASCNVGQVQQ